MRASLVYHIRFTNRNKNARNEVANKLIFETRKGFAMMFGLKVILIQQKNHFYTFSIWIEQLLPILIYLVIKSQWNFWTQFRSVFQMIGKGTNFHDISKKNWNYQFFQKNERKTRKNYPESSYALSIRCGRVVTDFLPYPKFWKGLLSW